MNTFFHFNHFYCKFLWNSYSLDFLHLPPNLKYVEIKLDFFLQEAETNSVASLLRLFQFIRQKLTVLGEGSAKLIVNLADIKCKRPLRLPVLNINIRIFLS